MIIAITKLSTRANALEHQEAKGLAPEKWKLCEIGVFGRGDAMRKCAFLEQNAKQRQSHRHSSKTEHCLCVMYKLSWPRPQFPERQHASGMHRGPVAFSEWTQLSGRGLIYLDIPMF